MEIGDPMETDGPHSSGAPEIRTTAECRICMADEPQPMWLLHAQEGHADPHVSCRQCAEAIAGTGSIAPCPWCHQGWITHGKALLSEVLAGRETVPAPLHDADPRHPMTAPATVHQVQPHHFQPDVAEVCQHLNQLIDVIALGRLAIMILRDHRPYAEAVAATENNPEFGPLWDRFGDALSELSAGHDSGHLMEEKVFTPLQGGLHSILELANASESTAYVLKNYFTELGGGSWLGHLWTSLDHPNVEWVTGTLDHLTWLREAVWTDSLPGIAPNPHHVAEAPHTGGSSAAATALVASEAWTAHTGATTAPRPHRVQATSTSEHAANELAIEIKMLEELQHLLTVHLENHENGSDTMQVGQLLRRHINIFLERFGVLPIARGMTTNWFEVFARSITPAVEDPRKAEAVLWNFEEDYLSDSRRKLQRLLRDDRSD